MGVENTSDLDRQLKQVLNELQDVRDKITKINEQSGSLDRYQTMKEEIRRLGWEEICSRYHPDVNFADPAAIELFQFYKFVYETMERP